MSTREDVLHALTEADRSVSGEWLARKLNVTRSAIWKVIGQLREEGYKIDAVTNRGYRLVITPELITEAEIRRSLKTKIIGARMEIHQKLDSTNTRAKTQAAAGAPHGYLVVADAQTSGKGRFGRTFHSPANTGVYISYVLRPQIRPEKAVGITSIAAVAAARAIEELADVDVKIKWVNDLFIAGKKVGGILCEASMDIESRQLECVILGIGINTGRARMPGELEDIATSIGNVTGKDISRSALIAGISNHLEELEGQLLTGEYISECRRRSNVIGSMVQVIRGNERFEALARDINDKGELVIEKDGELMNLDSGEISLKLIGRRR